MEQTQRNQDMLKRFLAGETQSAIAIEFGLTRSKVSDIVNREARNQGLLRPGQTASHLIERNSEKDVLDYIRQYIAENSISPTQSEISQALNIQQPIVNRLLTTLANKKLISFERYQRRSIKILTEQE